MRAFTLWMLGADMVGSYGKWHKRIRLTKNSLFFLFKEETIKEELECIARYSRISTPAKYYQVT